MIVSLSEASLEAENSPKIVCGRALSGPTGGLAALPQDIWINGGGRERDGKEGKERGGREGKGRDGRGEEPPKYKSWPRACM